MDAKIDAAQAPQCFFQQVEAGREVATMDGQNAAEATAKSVPEVPVVAHRQLDEIRNEFFNGGQIADHQPDRAGCLDEHLTQRERATFIVAGTGPLLSICALGLLPAPSTRRTFVKRPPPFRALLRNRALIGYVAAFAGNTWEVFAVRVWFVAYLAWLLRLPGNYIPLPPLGLVSGIASLAGVPVSMVMADIAARRGRRPVVIGICLVSVATCLVLAATAGGSIRIVLPLMVLVQITSFADVGALAGGAVAAADPAQRGAALALYALAGFTTGFLAPVAVGSVLDRFGGVASASGWVAAYLVIAFGSAFAAWAVWRTPG